MRLDISAMVWLALAQGCVREVARIEDQPMNWECIFQGGKVPSGGFIIEIPPEATKFGYSIGTYWQALDTDADRPVERTPLKRKNLAFAPAYPGAPDPHGVRKDYSAEELKKHYAKSQP